MVFSPHGPNIARLWSPVDSPDDDNDQDKKGKASCTQDSIISSTAHPYRFTRLYQALV